VLVAFLINGLYYFFALGCEHNEVWKLGRGGKNSENHRTVKTICKVYGFCPELFVSFFRLEDKTTKTRKDSDRVQRLSVARDRDQWRALVNTVMNLRVP
jgi:hypothetical protein